VTSLSQVLIEDHKSWSDTVAVFLNHKRYIRNINFLSIKSLRQVLTEEHISRFDTKLKLFLMLNVNVFIYEILMSFVAAVERQMFEESVKRKTV
jgi:hypothetical protein